MEPSISQNCRSQCDVCNQRCAIYTCPRCAIRSCSLSCSKTHKALQSCSGERDKVVYVPMNKYNWGTMVNDYVYLEEVGRKAAEWRLDIVRGGLSVSAATSQRHRREKVRTRRDILKRQLESQGIDMETLPPGMEKRRINQSTWDAKTKSLLLTIEFVFHPPDELPPRPTFTLLTHRNRLDITILDTVSRCVRERGKKGVVPLWIKTILWSSQDEGDPPFDCFIAQHTGSPSNPLSKTYHKLDLAQSLLMTLHDKTFTEYPTIDIWEKGNFMDPFVDINGTYVGNEETLRPMKRRRLDVAAGQELIQNLLGGYSSGGETDAGVQQDKHIMDMLDNYGSDKDSGNITNGADEASEDAYSEGSEELTLEDVCEISEAIGQDTGAMDLHTHGLEEIPCDDSTDDETEDLEHASRGKKYLTSPENNA